MNTCSVSGSTHIITVFTKTEVSSPFYRLRQLKLREVKKFTKGVPLPKWRSWGWSTFLSPKLMSFPSCPPSPNQGWGCRASHGTAQVHMAAWEGAQFFFRVGVSFFPLCPRCVNFLYNQLREINRRLPDPCLYGQQCLPLSGMLWLSSLLLSIPVS